MTDNVQVLGVDGCKKGWVGVTPGPTLKAHFGRTIGELLSAVSASGPSPRIVAIDIPIGLPDDTTREADVQVRPLLGLRRSSLFMTPTRRALEEDTYERCNEVSRALTGAGISRQSYGLRAKILEIDRWVRSDGLTMIEVHPELCFTKMVGAPMSAAKSTWSGASQRRQALTAAGLIFPDDLGSAGLHAAVDDVLDAAVAPGRQCGTGAARPSDIRLRLSNSAIGLMRRSGPEPLTFTNVGACQRRAVAVASGDCVSAFVGRLHHDRLHDGVIERPSERWCRREGRGGRLEQGDHIPARHGGGTE